MELERKVRSVNRVYRQLAIHTSTFKKNSGLACVSGCSACCVKPDIEATVLEFLPAAYELYMTNSYEPVLEKLNSLEDTSCIFYNPMNLGGACTNYQNRGMVCRLFGFSSKLDKYAKLTLVSCKILKQQVDPETISAKLIKAPDMNGYYMKLFGIDPELATKYFPINQAIKIALEIVLLHFQYRKRPA